MLTFSVVNEFALLFYRERLTDAICTYEFTGLEATATRGRGYLTTQIKPISFLKILVKLTLGDK